MASNMVARRSLSTNAVITRTHNEPLNVRDRQTMHRTIIKQGYLKKLPNAARIGASLKKVERRWFVFGIIGRTDPYLEYYENEDSIFGSRPLNIVFLDTCYNITRNQKTSRFCNIFTLVLKDRLLSLVAPTRDAMFEWSRAIEGKLCSLGIMESSHGNNDYIRVPLTQRHSFHELAIEAPVQPQERHYLDVQASGGSFSMIPAPLEPDHTAPSRRVNEACYENVSRNRATQELLEDTYVLNSEVKVDDGIYVAAAPDSENIYENSTRQETVYDIDILNSDSMEEQSDVQCSLEPPDSVRDLNSGVSSASLFSVPSSGLQSSNDSPCTPPASESSSFNARPIEMCSNNHEVMPICPPSYEESVSSTKTLSDDFNRYCGLQPLAAPPFPISSSRTSTQSTDGEPVPHNSVFPNSRTDGDCCSSPPPAYSSQKMLLRGAHVPLKQAQLQKLVQERKDVKGVQVIIPKTQCRNTIAFVECFNRIWIGGWNQRLCPTFHALLHVGDQLVAINGVAPTNRQMAKKLLKACAGKSDATITIRRIPCGQVYGINRENGSTDSLGLMLVNRTAEIGLVDPTGLARESGLEEKAVSMNGGERESWWITEVNNHPLNLFFKDDEARQRLNAVGSHVSFVVQPTQLIVEIKKQLKNSKGFRDFLVH